MEPTIQVMYYTGWFDLKNPTPAMVDVRDVALGLSRQSRYNGFTIKYYSVAEHCTLVAAYLMKKFKNPELAMMGLLHDAAEAYVGDLVAPIKVHMPEYVIWEYRVAAAIYKKLIPKKSLWYGRVGKAEMINIVKAADIRIRIDETDALMKSGAKDLWAHNNARELSLEPKPLGIWHSQAGVDHGLAEKMWLNAYNMYRSMLEHGVPS